MFAAVEDGAHPNPTDSSSERGRHSPPRSISPLSRTSATPYEQDGNFAGSDLDQQHRPRSISILDDELNPSDDSHHKRERESLYCRDDGFAPCSHIDPSTKTQPRLADRWNGLATDWWLWEFCAILVSMLSLVAIVLVLLLHQGRPLPDWPWSITLNSLVSVFATIMSGTMLVPVTAGIGQAKWQWFRKEHALSDVEVYDQASRGPWGALKMVWNIRWRHVSTIGALVTVLALGIDPFVQQVVVYRLEQVPLHQNATLPIRFAAFPILSDTRGPVYSALFGLGNYTQVPYCPSDNCTWSPYQSLAVCSQCADISDQISFMESEEQVPQCDDDYQHDCTATAPNGLKLEFPASPDNRSITLIANGTLPSTTFDSVGYTLANFSLLETVNYQDKPQYRGSCSAIECSLYWCVNTYTAEVHNAQFNESLQSSWYDASTAIPYHPPSDSLAANFTNQTYYNITPPSRDATFRANVNQSLLAAEEAATHDGVPGLAQDDFIVVPDSSVQAWLGPLLSGNASQEMNVDTAGDVIGLFMGADFEDISSMFARVAQYLTVKYRDPSMGTSRALGIAWQSQTIVRVRWAWLTLPCVLLAASLLVLGTTAIGSKRAGVPLWKSNTLALLFHGPSELQQPNGLHTTAIEQSARTVQVRLGRSKSGDLRLLSTADHVGSSEQIY